MAMTKVKNLQLWCKKMAEGYRDVEVRDMAASWKSGLAFCAIIHRFRPDLIDYDSLSKENVFENNNLAFEVAEKQLNIPAFLEAADMVAIRVPDKLSIVTYVSQYYNYFHDKPQLGGPGLNKFVSSGKKKDVSPAVTKSLTPARSDTENTPVKRERQDTIGDKCSICNEKVYLLERHIENGKLCHRSCFRKTEMSPTSKVFKRQPYLSVEEEKRDLIGTKQRKIDKSENSGEKQLDFWERRNQAKSKEKPKVDTVAMDVQVNDTGVSFQREKNVSPFKKGTDEKKDSPAGKVSTALFDKESKTDESKPKVNYAEKFRQLNERNLKQLGDEEKTVTSTGVLNEKKNVKSETNDFHPKAKPRQKVVSRFEKMDTSENHPEPKPVPRFQKPTSNFSATTPQTTETKPKSPQAVPKSGFSRPKTPPEKHKAEFKLNLSPVSTSTSNEESPRSPPPLPNSMPPTLAPSQQSKTPSSVSKFHLDSPKRDFKKAPKSTSAIPDIKKSPESVPKAVPRKSDSSVSQGLVQNKVVGVAPAKPARASAAITENRSHSPMETNELHEPAKAHIKGPNGGHDAVLVVPNRPNDEKKNREVFGGLLKSLAEVRNRHDNEVVSKTNVKAAKALTESEQKKGFVKASGDTKAKVPMDTNDKFEKVPEKVEARKKESVKKPERPKTSYVSQSKFLEQEKSDLKQPVKIVTTKTTTTTVVTTETKGATKSKDMKETAKDESGVPEWKRKLEERKKAKERPKSADILTESTKTENLLEWQKEAAKRKEARKGGYEDPEKPKWKPSSAINSEFSHKSNVNQNSDSDRLTLESKTPQPTALQGKEDKHDNHVPKAQSPKLQERRKININSNDIDKHENTKPNEESQKKRITVDFKFKFEDIDMKPAPKKPPRPGAPPVGSPSSPKSHPARPPPPRFVSNFQPTKHHISAYQIQKQLQMIDTKLTDLELKGRTLEDAIRSGKEEEEDNLMIKWFQLVNEKNELVRRECDFIYINRQQELEIEQYQIDQQLRDLVDKPDKTEEDELEEKQLMDRLLDVVDQRNKIVDSIDEDRLRYLEEDSHIEAMLQQKAFKLPEKTEKKSKKKGAKLGLLKGAKKKGNSANP